MKPVLCIPSYSRPDSITLERCKDLPLQKFVFIRREQESLYSKWKPWYKLILQDHGTDIGLVRRNIATWCYRKGYKWAFMFDDDICKVEQLGFRKDKNRWDSQRIIDGSLQGPRFETKALQYWFCLAKEWDLSISSPSYRTNIGGKGPTIHINKHPCIQCVLIKIPDIIAVGNYKSIHKTGNEDYYIQYRLMDAGCLTGIVNVIEYDCPSVGNCPDGTEDTMEQKYRRYIQAFQQNVCSDPNKMTTKTTKTGFPSLQFVWKYWNGFVVDLP